MASLIAGQMPVVVVSPRLSWQLHYTDKGGFSSWCKASTELVRLVSSNFPSVHPDEQGRAGGSCCCCCCCYMQLECEHST